MTLPLAGPGQARPWQHPYAGHSAIDAFLLLHRAPPELENVPDLLIAQSQLGVAFDEPPDAARAAQERCLVTACAADPWLRDPPGSVSWPGGQFASGRLGAAAPAGGPGPSRGGRCQPDYQTAEAGHPLRQRPLGSTVRRDATVHLSPGRCSTPCSPSEQVRLSELEAVAAALVLATLRAAGTH